MATLLERTTLDKLKLRRFDKEQDVLKKARPTHHTRKFGEVLQGRCGTGTTLKGWLAKKADGFSGRLSYSPEGGLKLYYRTKAGEFALDLKAPEKYLTRAALLETFDLHVEMVALVNGQELGHYFVRKALKAFLEGNTGPFRLRLRAFALQSIKHRGAVYTPKSSSLWFLSSVLVRDNDLVDIVAYREIEIQCKMNNLLFYENGKRIAIGFDEFVEGALKAADQDGSEGWVFKVDEHVFEHEDGHQTANDPTKLYSFETLRDRSSLKIKREPQGEFWLVKLLDKTDPKDEEMVYWLFGRRGDRLKYACDVTDNQRLKAMIDARKSTGAEFSSTEAMKRLYDQPPSPAIRNAALQVKVSSAGITPGCYLSGVKQYNVFEQPRPEFANLSDVQALARDLPHFVATKRARAEYERITKDSEGEEPPIRCRIGVSKKRARPSEPAATPLSRQRTPGGPNTARQESPEREELVPEVMEVVAAAPAPMPQRLIDFMRRPGAGAPLTCPEPVPIEGGPTVDSDAEPESIPESIPADEEETAEDLEAAEVAKEDEAWAARLAEITKYPAQEQKIYYYKFGEKVEYTGPRIQAIPFRDGYMEPAFLKGRGAVVEADCQILENGQYTFRTMFIDNPPAPPRQPTVQYYRRVVAGDRREVRCYVDKSCNLRMPEVDVLHQKIKFFGGKPAFTLDASVDVVITSPGIIKRAAIGPPGIFWDLKEQSRDTVEIMTPDDVQGFLRKHPRGLPREAK